jgi:hypothetical protein
MENVELGQDFGEQVDTGKQPVEMGNDNPQLDMSFDDILGYDYSDQDMSDGEEGIEASQKLDVDLVEEEVKEPEQATNEAKRYEYWQSQYDKMRQEYETYQKQTTHLKDLDAAIRSDENLLGIIKDYFTKSGQPQPVAETSRPPKDFDPYEAYNEPESESFKWRVQKEQEDRVRIINEARQAAQSDIMRQLQAEAEAQYRVQQEKLFREQYKDVPEERWSEFIGWAKNPANVTMDALWKLYNLANTSKSMETNAKKQITEQLKRTQSIPTMSAGANAQRPSKTKEEEFADSIIRTGNAGIVSFF